MATSTKYNQAVGRRKRAVARVRITEAAKNSYVINDKDIKEYFPTIEMQALVTSALTTANAPKHYAVSVHVSGGGIHSQAEAVRHGIARSLSRTHTETRSTLKKAGFLTRDEREKERRKFGLKKARKSPQWSKR